MSVEKEMPVIDPVCCSDLLCGCKKQCILGISQDHNALMMLCHKCNLISYLRLEIFKGRKPKPEKKLNPLVR